MNPNMTQTITYGCPKCGGKSVEFGHGASTLMYFPSFTDDQGKLHQHDNNINTVGVSCKKCGLTFEIEYGGSCWCGWEGRELILRWGENKMTRKEWQAKFMETPK